MLSAVRRRHRHLDRQLDAARAGRRLDEADHPLDSCNRLAFQAERQRQVEHRFRVCCALDRGEQRVVDGQQELAPDTSEVADQPVVHPEPVAVAERMRVGLLDGGAGRGADVRKEQRRGDAGGELTEVAVVPRR